VDIPAAADDTAAWFEADPVFALVFAGEARVKHCCALEGFNWSEVVGSAVRTVFFGNDGVKALEVHSEN
jgi:hypothetical protein